MHSGAPHSSLLIPDYLFPFINPAFLAMCQDEHLGLDLSMHNEVVDTNQFKVNGSHAAKHKHTQSTRRKN